MRALIVGAGSIARRHVTSLRQIMPGIEVEMLREAGRDAALSDFGAVGVSTSLEDAMRHPPDVMVIASPSAFHLRYVIAAIDHAVPFYVEKPVVANAQDLATLKTRLATARVPTNIVGCNLRFLPSLQRLKQIVTEGELGCVARAGFEAGQWLPDWRPQRDYRQSYSAKKALGGGVLLDLIHEVDAAAWLLGGFTRVEALITRASQLNIETEDCACLLLGRPGGPLVTVQLDYVSRRPVRRYTVVGDRATADWDLQRHSLVVSGPDGSSEIALDAGAYDVSQTYLAAMRDLLGAAGAGRPSSQPLEEGIRALDLVLAARTPRSEL